jgi:4-carboxymuconolactone decarboxylase
MHPMSEGLSKATAAGWAGMRSQIDGDGALSAREKALIAAMVAAVRGREEVASEEASRLSALGGADQFAPAASMLALARGRATADRLAAAAGLELTWDVESTAAPDSAPAAPAGSPPATPAGSPPAPASTSAHLAGSGSAPDAGAVEDALSFFTPPGAGAAPAAIELLARHAPAGLLGYRSLREGVYDGPLAGKLIELALFAVCAGEYVAPHAASHATRASAAGATEAELVEAGLCAVPASGMGAWLVAAEAIGALGTGGAADGAELDCLRSEVEIRDVIARYCQGVDSQDYDRVRECYHPDAIHERGDYQGSGPEVVDWIASIRDTLIHCWHLVGYPRIEKIEGDEATVETYTLANQRLPNPDGTPRVDRLTPCRYLDTFTRVDSHWRIAVRKALYLPAQELPVSADVESPDSFSGAK